MNYDIIPEYKIVFKDDCFNYYGTPNITSIAHALSYWGYLYTEKDTSNKTFFEESVGVVGIIKDDKKQYLIDKTIITELGVLRAWKSSFEALGKDGLTSINLSNNFNYLYRLIVKEQERCIREFEETSVKNMLMTLPVLSYLDNPNNEFFRLYYLFIKNRELFTVKYSKQNYADIFSKFEAKYNMTLYEYMEALYLIIMCKCEANFIGLKKTRDLGKYNFLISQNEFVDTNTKNKIRKALDMLSFDYNEAHIWSCATKEEDFNFKLFQEKPLYKLTDEIYVPITRKYMQDQSFNSLIYRIRSLYDSEDKSFWDLLGYLFEEYVEYIFQQAIKNIKYNYKIIPKFNYGWKEGKKDSSDLIVIFDNNVCVFELKSARPLNSIFSYDNEKKLDESIDKVVKFPIKQCIKRTNEIVFSTVHNDLTEDKNYYFIALTLGNFPDHYADYSDIKATIKESKLKIKGLFNFSIEEFELLCGAIEQDRKKLVDYLEEYKQLPAHFSFKNYISKKVDKSAKKNYFNELEEDLKKFTDKINF